MKYPAKNPAKFLKPEPEPEPDIEAGYPAGSGFSRISGRFLVLSEVVEDESTWTDATPNAENQVEDISVEFCDDDPTIMSFSNGKQYHIDYAVQKYCNDGRTTMSGQSRVSRFQVVPSSELTLKAECPRGSSGCLVMYIGAVGTFGVTTKGRFGKKRKENKKGKILFIARAESDTKSVYRSSVNYRPLNTACRFIINLQCLSRVSVGSSMRRTMFAPLSLAKT